MKENSSYSSKLVCIQQLHIQLRGSCAAASFESKHLLRSVKLKSAGVSCQAGVFLTRTAHTAKRTTHTDDFVFSPSNLKPQADSLVPEDALCLRPAQGQHILGELDLHPGQLPVREELTLPLHHLLQGAAEQGGCDDGPPAVVDLLQGGLAETLAR